MRTVADTTILVVEDDPGVAALEADLIQGMGYTAVVAPDGRTALDWLLAHAPPALMLLDHSLPGMSGLGMLDALEKCRHTPPPFIITTGAGDEQIAVDMMKHGARDYLIKDVRFLDALPRAIRRVLDALPPMVLVIEDDPGLARLVAETLADMGLETDIAATGKAALEKLSAHTPALLLLDYSLPDMTGIALIDALGARGQPTPPFIVTTGAGDEQVAVGLMKRGAHDYLIKDAEFLTNLPKAVRRSLHEIEMAGRLAAAEREVADQLQRYRSILDTTSDGFAIMSKEGQFLDVNQAYCTLTDYPRKSLIGQSLTLLKPPEMAGGVADRMREIIAAGTLRYETTILARDGRKIAVEVSAAYEKTQGIMAFVRDITARKQAEASLRLAAQVMASTSEAIMVADATRHIIEVNAAFEHITGYGRDEIIGRSPDNLQPGHLDDQAIGATVTRALAATGHWQGEAPLRRSSGEIFTAWLNISRIESDHGKPDRFVTLFSDISTVKASAERLDYLAHHDPLTSLPNRLLFSARLKHSLDLARRNQSGLGLLFIDLDHFKAVNDRLGHAAGDNLLRLLASRMDELLRDEDTLARLGGDEFVLLIEGAKNEGDLRRVVNQLLALFPHPVATPLGTVNVTASIGGALSTEADETCATLMGRADAAMYMAKKAGRNAFVMYCD